LIIFVAPRHVFGVNFPPWIAQLLGRRYCGFEKQADFVALIEHRLKRHFNEASSRANDVEVQRANRASPILVHTTCTLL